MRSAALCLLAIAAPGCNWLLGIDETLLAPPADGPPGDGPLPIARLTWMNAVTEASGAPAAMPLFPAISPAPRIQIGRIGETLTDAEIDDTGVIRVPYDFEGSTWRLVYTLANDVPHEVHWMHTEDTVPHATVPLFGRVDRAPIPGPQTSVDFTATGASAPANHRGALMFSTGVWTESQPVTGQIGPAFRYNFNQSIQLSGPPGAPERAKGDFFVVSDFIVVGACRVSEGSARYTVDLIDGISPTVTSDQWRYSARQVITTGDDDIPLRVRVQAAAGAGTSTLLLQVGPTPSSAMPAFTQRGTRPGVRAPLLLSMLECTNAGFGMSPLYNLPDSLVIFPQVAHLQLSAERTVTSGPKLVSSLAIVKPVVTDMANLALTISLPQPPFTFGPAGGTVTDLGVQDGTQLPASTGPLVLTFANEAPPLVVADYYDVILHRVSGTAAIAERIFTVTSPTVTIAPTDLAPATTYVFEIRAFIGAPDVGVAGFARFSPVQQAATVWTHTFRTP